MQVTSHILMWVDSLRLHFQGRRRLGFGRGPVIRLRSMTDDFGVELRQPTFDRPLTSFFFANGERPESPSSRGCAVSDFTHRNSGPWASDIRVLRVFVGSHETNAAKGRLTSAFAIRPMTRDQNLGFKIPDRTHG